MTGSAEDDPEWQRHIGNRQRRRELANQFKDAKNPFMSGPPLGGISLSSGRLAFHIRPAMLPRRRSFVREAEVLEHRLRPVVDRPPRKTCLFPHCVHWIEVGGDPPQ